VTKHLTKSFVYLRGLSLTAQPVTEFRFDHAERRFDIASLVIPLEKKLAVEFVIVIHLPPEDVPLFRSCVSGSVWPKSRFNIRVAGALERDIGHRVMVYNRLQIVFRTSRLCPR
jgi:hypothetical protein